MALQSNMVPLGTALPSLTLPDLDGHTVQLSEVAGNRVLLVVFACNHCPYVRHLETALGQLVEQIGPSDLATVAICSNDVAAYPDDDIAGLRGQVARAGWTFPYLVDSDQRAAREFHAACTPDFFVFDRNSSLAYRGAFDRSTPGNQAPLNGEELRAALTATIAGEPVPGAQRPAMGCGIKWKPGNEPS